MNHSSKQVAHVVMWKINGEDDATRQAQKQVLLEAFHGVKDCTPGLIRMEIGSNFIEAPDAWDVALYMVFSSREALEDYLAHPAHLDVKKKVEPIRSARCQVDFLIDSDS